MGIDHFLFSFFTFLQIWSSEIPLEPVVSFPVFLQIISFFEYLWKGRVVLIRGMIILLERMRTRKDLEPLFHNLEGIIFLPSLGTPPQRLGSSLVIFLFEDEGDEPKGELTTSSSVINVINDLDAYLDEACDLMDKEDRIKFEI